MGSGDKNNWFVPLPGGGAAVSLAWPTPNRTLFSAPSRFFAATAANPAYGRPGWTRDRGRRFHRGCDIAAVDARPTGEWVEVEFTDLQTGREYRSAQPAFVPRDEVFCVVAGRVVEAVIDPDQSTFGVHAVVGHAWPGRCGGFFTLYAHLERCEVRTGEAVARGQCLGRMGRTSRSREARKWMAIAPHLHFEVWDGDGRAYDPEQFLRRFLPAPGPSSGRDGGRSSRGRVRL